MAKQPTTMAIESVVMELPDTKTIRLKWPAGYEPEFKTGQFITLYWPDAIEYKRAYSLSSCALDRGYYEVTVKRDGKMGTRLVDWARPGDCVWVMPPAGRFLPVYEPDKHLLCLAGGSGVTPFRGFVREATRRQLQTRITILYSVRTPQDIIYQNEFRALAEENPQFKFHVTCTRVRPDDDWPGRRGRFDAAWVRGHIADPATTFCYACGPNDMVEAAERLVEEELQMPKAQLRVEKWS